MGNMSSRDPKTENSESSWEDRYEAFVTGGACKEAFIAFGDCAEKNEGNIGKCMPMVLSCMEEHSDYYEPFFAAKRNTEEHMDKEFDAFFLTKAKAGDPKEGYLSFMEGGGCKESAVAWDYCKEEAMKKDGSTAKCKEGFSMLMRCMESRSDYYHPFLELKKSGDQLMIKEMDALLRN